MKHLSYITFITILLLLSSCAIHNGTLSSSDLSEEYVYDDIAVGVSQANRFFWLGGLSKDALVLEAKRQLYRSRPLKSNERYANFSVDTKRTYFFIFAYFQTKVTITADVVLKASEPDAPKYSDRYLSKIKSDYSYNNLFEIGDTILTKQLKKGVILGLVSSNETSDKLRILFVTENNNYKSKKISIYNIFSTKNAYKGLKPGNTIDKPSRDIKGTIVAVGVNGFIYQDELDGVSFYKKYDN